MLAFGTKGTGTCINTVCPLRGPSNNRTSPARLTVPKNETLTLVDAPSLNAVLMVRTSELLMAILRKPRPVVFSSFGVKACRFEFGVGICSGFVGSPRCRASPKLL